MKLQYGGGRMFVQFGRSRTAKVLSVICGVLFSVSIALGLIGVSICVRDNDAYQTVFRDEIRVPEVIDEVWCNEENGMIYVGYDIASCVNVYDTKGNFIWAVSIPYESNGETDFLLYENQLMISHTDTYIYDAQNGTFLERIENKEIQDITVDTVKYNCAACAHTSLEVYHVSADGHLTSIVSKPLWVLFFSFPFELLIAFGCVLVFELLWLFFAILERRKRRKKKK